VKKVRDVLLSGSGGGLWRCAKMAKNPIFVHTPQATLSSLIGYLFLEIDPHSRDGVKPEGANEIESVFSV
jgi:hypothetical protein